MKAMILAAGKGTRLGELTTRIPKVLIKINGKSILQHMVEKCAGAGFSEMIINVHHLAGMVIDEIERLNRLGYRISVSDETEILLETGGGLYKARGFFDRKPFLLANADILTDLDLKKLLAYHKARKGLATLAVRDRVGKRFFLINSNGLLKGWINTATGEKILAGDSKEELRPVAFSSFHIIEPEIFRYMHEGIYTMTTLYLDLASNHPIYTYTQNDGYWFDIGTPEKLQDARNFFSDKENT
jgi:NDP-sugar pyrophosphorylase family protein